MAVCLFRIGATSCNRPASPSPRRLAAWLSPSSSGASLPGHSETLWQTCSWCTATERLEHLRTKRRRHVSPYSRWHRSASGPKHMHKQL